MFKFVVPAAAALGLLAFAAHSQAEQEEAPPAPMGWHSYKEGSTAKLAYGVANSDVLAVMMTCAPGDPMVTIYGSAQPDTPRLVKAGGPSELDPLSGGDFVEAKAPLSDPVFRDLAGKGVLKVKGEAGKGQLRASQSERQLVGQFFGYCAGRKG